MWIQGSILIGRFLSEGGGFWVSGLFRCKGIV